MAKKINKGREGWEIAIRLLVDLKYFYCSKSVRKTENLSTDDFDFIDELL